MDGFSMPIKSALQFQINAKLMVKTVIVRTATQDMTLLKVNVYSLNSTMLDPLTLDVELGTGKTRYA